MGETLLAASILEHTAGDGYRWRYRHWPSAGEPRGHVVCVHGIQSHGGWYEASCDRLARAGFRTYFLDRRGAGMNDQERGDAPGFRRLLDDVAEFLRTLAAPASATAEISDHSVPSPRSSVLRAPVSPRRPIFLIGISWGGKLTVALQRRYPGLVDGLALLCPGFYPKLRPPLKQRLAILGARLVAPRRLFPIPLNEPDLFTANPRWQEFIGADPLRLRRATARLLVESVRLDGYLRFVPRYVRVPVLLLLAQHDRIIDNARTRRFVERFAEPDRTVIEYPGAHHTLEFEPDANRFINDLTNWLEDHTPLRGSRPPGGPA